MSRSNTRDKRTATTFWMDKGLKVEAQDLAGLSGITLTDLINRAVQIYIEEGFRGDQELGQKIAAAEIARDIKGSGRVEMELAAVIQTQKGLQARLTELEKSMQDFVSKEEVRLQINAHMSDKISPFLKIIAEKLDALELSNN